ncbi:MAG TPA: PEGA domain-containing protein [Polyangiaceae bacterium]
MLLDRSSARCRHLVGALLTVTVFVLPLPALAQSNSSEAVVEARRGQAKLSFQRGAELYRAGQYEAAVKAFLEADRLAPSPALSFNIARAYERLDDASGALRWYRDYLRRSPAAKNAPEVRARVAELAGQLARGGVQQISIFSTPTGASVLIDGRPAGVTPFTSDLKPGKHRIQLELAGYEPTVSEALLEASAPLELNLTLPRDTTPTTTLRVSSDPEQPGGEPAAREGGRRFGPVPWLVLGAGAASLGVAAGFELARRADEDDARAATSQLEFKAELDSMERHQTTARVFAGVGAGLLVTGGVMLALNRRVDGSARDSAAPQLEASPRLGFVCLPDGCAASARGTF